MSIQECALYGELVRHLRDRCAERIAELDPAGSTVAAKAGVDSVICDWFFAPQKDLYGDAPREVIWREQKDEPNIVPQDHAHEIFFDDCPICQGMKELDLEVEWHWHYDDGGYPLIAEYDPEGWHARWAGEDAALKQRPERGEIDPTFPFEDLPDVG